MPRYPKYATTVIGAHSVPDWYEALDRLVAVGQLSMGSMADAQFRSGEAAILDQENAGIDVITGGEMHRRTHNRHSPPNAMLNYFWQKIPAFQGATKPKPITPYDPNVFHPAATCRSRIFDNVDLGLADEFRMVSALTRKPVKVTMTGPLYCGPVLRHPAEFMLPAVDLGGRVWLGGKPCKGGAAAPALVGGRAWQGLPPHPGV